MEKILEITNMSKSYGNTLAVNDISLTALKEIFGFIGQMGQVNQQLLTAFLNFIFQDKRQYKSIWIR